MRRRFFVDQFEAGRAHMRGDDAHHLARVLRAAPGQLYELSDGASVWLARIERAARDRVEFSLLERIPAAAPKLSTALLLSIVKFDRFEWALEKATELGVSAIVPLAAARSEKSLVAAAAKRAARWQKILLESAQQSRRLRPPVLHPLEVPASAFHSSLSFLPSFSSPSSSVLSSSSVPSVLNSSSPSSSPSFSPSSSVTSVPSVLNSSSSPSSSSSSVPSSTSVSSVLNLSSVLMVFLSESPSAPSLKAAVERKPNSALAVLAIGPEGGWTDPERAAALAAGFAEASLGSNILRTETAVAAALAALHYALGG